MNSTPRIIVSLMMVMALLFAGCAETEDGRKTQGQGTALGAVGGAIIGGLIGYATGGGVEGLVTGAASGAVAGGVVGYAYGSSVAKKKAEYAKAEDGLDFAIGEAGKMNTEAHNYNVALANDVKNLEKQNAALAAATGNNRERRAQKGVLDKKIAANKEQIKKLDYQTSDLNQCLGGKSVDAKRETALRSEIQKLSGEKQQLEKLNQTLAAGSSRMSM